MASKMYQHVTIIYLAMAILSLFASPSEAKYKNINPFCRTSDYRRICNTMVRGATNWHDATRNAVQSALTAASIMRSMAPQLDQALQGVPEPSKADTLSTCKDNFDSAVDNLKQSLKFIDANDNGGLNSYLSAAIDIGDCKDAFKQVGVEMPLSVAKISDNVSIQVSNCLAVSQQN